MVLEIGPHRDWRTREKDRERGPIYTYMVRRKVIKVKHTFLMIDLLEFLGCKINREKCILDPCQDIEFLGIQWNTKINRMSLPRKKANKIIALINKIKSKNF